MQKNDLIFGIRAIIEAIQSGKELDKILLKTGLRSELFSELSTYIKDLNIPVQYVPIEKINRISQKNHQGALAFLSPVTYLNVEEIVQQTFEAGNIPLILILDKITDVRNFGAIARTAECAGIHAIVIPNKGSAQINADAVKTSAGALHHIPVCRTENLIKTIKYLKNSGVQMVAATEKAAENYYQTDFTLPTAIIMGSEDTGISDECLKIADKLVKIPIQGEIESLNVSVAAAILMYEAVKQRLAIQI